MHAQEIDLHPYLTRLDKICTPAGIFFQPPRGVAVIQLLCGQLGMQVATIYRDGKRGFSTLNVCVCLCRMQHAMLVMLVFHYSMEFLYHFSRIMLFHGQSRLSSLA